MAARVPAAFRTLKVSLILLLLAACIVFYKVDRKEVRSSPNWQYFNQVITGNWSSSQPDKAHPQDGKYITDDWYVAGLIGAMIINFGPLLALISAALALLERKTEMDLLTAFASRDLNIEVTIVNSLTEAQNVIAPGMQAEFLKIVHTAIDEAKKDWWGPNLDERFGPEKAERMRAKMQEISLTP